MQKGMVFTRIIDMFKPHENPLCICYSTQKSDIGTVVGLGNIFKLHLWLGLFSDDFEIFSLPIKSMKLAKMKF